MAIVNETNLVLTVEEFDDTGLCSYIGIGPIMNLFNLDFFDIGEFKGSVQDLKFAKEYLESGSLSFDSLLEEPGRFDEPPGWHLRCSLCYQTVVERIQNGRNTITTIETEEYTD